MASTINASNSGFGGIVSTGDSSGQLQLQTANTTALTLDTSQNATFAGKVTSAGALTLASNGSTTAVTIDTSQNVGIGTTSPTYKLQTTISGNTTAARFTNGTTTTDIYCGGTFSYVGSAGANNAIKFDGTNNIVGFDINGTERMRIDSSGNVLVGTTTLRSSYITTVCDATYNGLTVTADSTVARTSCAFRNPNGSVGSITTSASSTAYNTSSDYRLKENIAPMTGALDTVAQLKPVTYTWKSDNSNGQGFIAHELQEVVPDCVTGEKDAVDEKGNPIHQGVDTSFLVATLTAAIQELKEIVDAQAERIKALEAK